MQYSNGNAANYGSRIATRTSTQSPTSTSSVDGDGKTTIADVTALINYLLSGEPTAGSGDVNGDSKVTIADVTALINLLLSGS